MEPLNLNPASQSPYSDSINLAPAVGSTNISEDTAASLTERLAAADVLQGKANEEIYQLFLDGKEKHLRQEVASDMTLRRTEERNRKLTDALNRHQGPLTLSEYRKIQDRIELETQYDGIIDPDYAFEKAQAEYGMNKFRLALVGTDNDLKDYIFAQPERSERLIQQGTALTAKFAVIDRLEQDARDTLKNQGLGSWLVDQAKSMFPIGGQIYTENKLRGITPGVGYFEGGLLGENLEKQRMKSFQKSLPEFTRDIVDTYNRIKQDNPTLAAAWISAMRGQGPTERFLNNLFTVAVPSEIGAISALARSGLRRAVGEVELRAAIKDVVKASATKGDIAVESVAAVGDISAAATMKSAKRLVKNFKPNADPIKEALDSVPSGFRADITDIKTNPSRLGNTLTNMIVEAYEGTMGRLTDVALNVAKVRRIPFEQATVEQIEAIKDSIKNSYTGISNSILDITSPTFNKVTSNWYVQIAVGKPGAELFANKNTLNNYMKSKGFADYTIDKQGLGYYARLTHNVPENHPLVQDLLVSSEKGQSKPSLVNATFRLGKFRTPEDTLSENARINRKVATYAQARLNVLANEERKLIEDVKKGRVRYDAVTGEEIPWYKRIPGNVLNRAGSTVTRSGKRKWERLESALKFNQTMPDPDDPSQIGGFFKSPLDLEDFYLRKYNELPTPEEQMAYFAHRRLNEIDRALRNLAVYKNKARLGAAQFTISAMDDTGKLIQSPAFDGMRQPHYPGGEDTVFVMESATDKGKFYASGEGSNIPTSTLTRIKDKITRGELQVIEVYDPEQRALTGFGNIKNQRVRYVVVPSIEESALSFNQVPRRGGGHFEYDYDFYIKQAKVRNERVGKKFTTWYEGDATVMPISLRSMGDDISSKLNEFRLLLKKKDVAGAKAYAEANLPIDYADLVKSFKSGQLSLDEPFVVVPRNKSIIELDKSLERRYEYHDEYGNLKSTFKDGTRSGSAARQFQVEYTGARDSDGLKTIQDVGSKGKPIYQSVEAELMDPMPVMNRALSKIINSSFMDDIKISQMEAWVRENRDLLKASDSELRHAPFWHFNNPEFKRGADDAKIAFAKATHWQLKQFIGVPSSTDTFLHSMSQRLADQAYKNLGPKGAQLVPHWMLHQALDPIKKIRALTYHAKLGLFAWPQIFVQNQTFTNIFALAPRSAVAGSYATFLHQWSRAAGPDLLNTLDKYAVKMNVPGFEKWKPGEFKEAHKLLNETGFGNVGGEYVNLDDISNFRTVRGPLTEFLDWGQVFFKQGEQNVRYGAWYTAYKEFRKKNPLGKIGDVERNQILDRADMLYTNMSRASASALHTGALSLTSQFLSYQMRLAELFWSKRIGNTPMERALTRTRMLAFNGMLYGLPIGLGVTGAPVAEYIRSEATKSGYVVGDKWLSSLVNEGIPAMMAALATGEGDAFDFPERLRTGNWYDVGQRYGSSGFEQIRQFMYGQKEWWELLGGPAISTTKSMFNGGSNFIRGMYNILSGTPKDFPMKWQDIVDPANQIASASGIRRHLYMLNTGKFLSNSETTMLKKDSISEANAWFMTLTGLSPTETRDVWVKRGILQAQQENHKEAYKEFIKEMQRSFDSADQKDFEQARDYRTRALAKLTLADYPPEKIAQALASSMTGRFSSMVEQIDWDLYFKYAPRDKQKLFSETYTKILNRNAVRQGVK